MNATGLLYSSASLLDTFENPILFLALVGLGILLSGLMRRSYGLVFFAAIGLTFVATHTLKLIFKVARPADALVAVDGYRFPSMHASIAGAFVTSIGWHLFFHTESRIVRGLIIIAGACIIAFVAWTRLLLGVHEFVDVAVGATLGIAIALILHGLMHRFIQR